ncbi:MAG: hypothetical protein Q9213_003761 [Squamulea squamosa]
MEAFKESAKGLRWRVLAGERYSVREVDLILAIESLWKVFLLAVESMSSRPWTIIACTLWILLNIAAQISVALVTLTYDMVDGRSFNDTYTKHGIVNATDLTRYYNLDHPDLDPWPVTAQATAHLYGERVLRTKCGFYKNITEVVESKHDHAYYCSKNMTNPEFAYRFNEYNPGDLQETYPRFTNRTITASAGECLVYEVKKTTDAPKDVDGRGPGKTFSYGNDTFTAEMQIPASSLGLSSTTYMYRGYHAPQDAALQTCGDPRCTWLWAYKNPQDNKTDNDRDPPKFYKCPITISNVTNIQKDSQIVSDDMARIAAVSIALQGRWSGSPKSRNFRSYQFYPFGTAWEIHNQSPRHVGENMARFAIGSLANLAALNPRIHVSGAVPYLGSHLEIRWGYVIGLFLGIILTHLFLYLSAILAVRKVAVKDDSFLAIARLLLPLLDVLGGEGTMLQSKELAKVIQANTPGEGLVVGPKLVEGGAQPKYSMGVGKDVRLRQEWPDHRHPAGTYV